MNYYNILINGMRDSNNDINSVYPVDDFESDIVFSKNRSCFLFSKVWLKL